MDLVIPTVFGSLMIALPAILLARIMFRRKRPIFYFALALIIVGTGYLATTKAPLMLARSVMGQRY